jgi:phosphoglycolate phosphatase-like HAD superfamily hydrolase
VTDFKIIFWDFDGVIKESTSIKADAYSKLFSHYGEEIANRINEHQLTHGGMSRYEKLPIYLQWAGEAVTPKTLDDLSSKFSEMVFQDILVADWVPGALEYLQSNYQHQIFILVTATPHEEIKKILTALGIIHLFKDIYGSPQKKTTAIAGGLTKFQCIPDNALMIGDSHVDLCAAKENGVRFLLRRTLDNHHLLAQYSIRSTSDFLDIKGLMNE